MCFIADNNVNSASITLNLACYNKEENINGNVIHKYGHRIIYSDGKVKNETFFFEDCNANDSAKLSTKHLNKNNEKDNQYSLFNEILNISNNNFAIKKVKSYPITNDGNFILNGKMYNLQTNLELANNSGSVCTFIDRMFIGPNIQKISIINKNYLNPIVFIDYDSLYLKNVNINCFRIPYISLDNLDKNSKICEIKDINANRYTVLESTTKKIVINGKVYSKQPIVIKNNKIEQYKLFK